MTIKEICELAEQAYEAKIVKPGSGMFYLDGCACAVGAAAAMLLHKEGRSIDSDTIDGMVPCVVDGLNISRYANIYRPFDKGVTGNAYNTEDAQDEETARQMNEFGKKVREKYIVELTQETTN